MKIVFLDAEFNSTNERFPVLVALSYQSYNDGKLLAEETFWLYNDTSEEILAFAVMHTFLKNGYMFCSYNLEAEIRCLSALFYKFNEYDLFREYGFKGVDLYLEYRAILNHNDALSYGWQYKNGQLIKTKKPLPKWERREKETLAETLEDEDNSKPSYALSGAIFKLLGEKIDTVEKRQVTELIYKPGWETNVPANKERILAYNKSDVFHLRPLLLAMVKKFSELGVPSDEWLRGAMSRGEYALATAAMREAGYPVNVKAIERFTGNVQGILNEAHRQLYAVEPRACEQHKKTGVWKLNTKFIREWTSEQGIAGWKKTEKGQNSTSVKTFKEWFHSNSEGFPGAFIRYCRTKQSLNGFLPARFARRGLFSDYLGSDGRVRPEFGIYTAQSSRSQPRATGFIPLKAHWMRTFIRPQKGFSLVEVDYSQQEFLIAAIMSQDKAMMEAYKSGDVYLAFAKISGVAPKEATKESHKKERDIAKTLTLGMSYDMGPRGLAPRLSQILGRAVGEGEAERYIDQFQTAYADYYQWKQGITQQYRSDGYLSLMDGWPMWGDNDNWRSVGNFPVQGHGAVVMREAVKLAQKRGIQIVYTVHDSLTAEYKSYQTGIISALMSTMQDAFETVMRTFGDTIPVRVDAKSWSPDYVERMPDAMDSVEFMSEYSTAKGAAELETYRKYFS